MKKLITITVLSLLTGLLALSCGDKKPEPKEIGTDTLTTAEKTADFALLPTANRVPGSEKFVESRFLDVPELNFVYTADYNISGDKFQLFMTRDYSGIKYINLRAAAGSIGDLESCSPPVVFDDDYGFAYDHPDYGPITVGLKNSRLVGIMGTDSKIPVTVFAAWVTHLPKPIPPAKE